MPDLSSLTNLLCCSERHTPEAVLHDCIMFTVLPDLIPPHGGIRVALPDVIRLARELVGRLTCLHTLSGKGGVSCC